MHLFVEFEKILSRGYISRPGMKGTLYGDSTGFVINGQRTWLDAKNGISSRRDYRKLHIVRAKNGMIIAHVVTDGRRHDAPVFEQMCKKIPQGSGYVILDAAYLSHTICTLIEDMGRIPVIMPKKNIRVKGFDAMGRMLRWHRDDLQGFLKIYRKRSNVESTFSSMKRRLSGTLSARKLDTQKIELGFFVLCHNLHVLATN
ncbi:MAG: Transposase [Cenarchaeum symbiont of Oopsacas minuta]|nr:Transposase [Cenarchaeum symbiont of Oopsacas minuta]